MKIEGIIEFISELREEDHNVYGGQIMEEPDKAFVGYIVDREAPGMNKFRKDGGDLAIIIEEGASKESIINQVKKLKDQITK